MTRQGDKMRRGRGAASNPPGRFERTSTEAFDDGWGAGDDDDAQQPIATRVENEASRTIISRNDSPDIPFERSINPYRGCEHGCVYCFARPSHAYLGYSPGLDFETRIVAKPLAGQLLRRALSKPGYRPEVIALGANTDPYQPVERRLRITREVLEVLWVHRHPVLIATKSQLVLRDLDLLRAMAEEDLVAVRVSVTTLDAGLARVMEPRAATPTRRLRVIERLVEAGVPTGALISPIIPAINDGEIEALLAAVGEVGALGGCYALLRLPHELKEVFTRWLDVHFPLRRQRVLELVKSYSGGSLYRAEFSERMSGSGPYAEIIVRRFEAACRRLGLRTEAPPLRTDAFRAPGAGAEQLPLF